MNISDPDKGLPEHRWLWRRLYVFLASLAVWRLLLLAVERVPAEALPGVARNLMGLLALVVVLYLVAPTAQHVVELLAQLRTRLLPGGRP